MPDQPRPTQRFTWQMHVNHRKIQYFYLSMSSLNETAKKEPRGVDRTPGTAKQKLQELALALIRV